MVAGYDLPPGTYDAQITDVRGESDGMYIEFKTAKRFGKSVALRYYIQAMSDAAPQLPECYKKPEFKPEDSWQSMNKGKQSKKQRRKL